MKNPGMDMEIWKNLRKKWSDLDAEGHKLKIDFQLITHPNEPKRIIAIDVIQHIDRDIIIETVQQNVGEGYKPLGIANLSIESLKEMYKGMMELLRQESNLKDIDVVVTMTPTLPSSGILEGYLEVPYAPVRGSLQLNYEHYYVLNALRDKMIEQTGKSWSSVCVIYHEGDPKFDFVYS